MAGSMWKDRVDYRSQESQEQFINGLILQDKLAHDRKHDAHRDLRRAKRARKAEGHRERARNKIRQLDTSRCCRRHQLPQR